MTVRSALPFVKPDGACPPGTRIQPAVSIRQANLADLDAMLDIGLTAMPLDPQWNWRFQHRFYFPEDHHKFTENTYREFLENKSGNWLVMLAEIAAEEWPGSLTPVAFAVWNLANLVNSQCCIPDRSSNGEFNKDAHDVFY